MMLHFKTLRARASDNIGPHGGKNDETQGDNNKHFMFYIPLSSVNCFTFFPLFLLLLYPHIGFELGSAAACCFTNLVYICLYFFLSLSAFPLRLLALVRYSSYTLLSTHSFFSMCARLALLCIHNANCANTNALCYTHTHTMKIHHQTALAAAAITTTEFHSKVL